jgi:hypothetical protein
MKDRFEHRCRRHPRIGPALGAGSGGEADGNKWAHADRTYALDAGRVFVTANGTTGARALSPKIGIIAGGTDGAIAPDGKVDVHGSKGVRITSGPPDEPPSENYDINGLEMQVGAQQIIKIMRGLDDDRDQVIQMTQGLIEIRGGDAAGCVSILAAEEISLQVAGGLSSIVMNKQGITIRGGEVHIN